MKEVKDGGEAVLEAFRRLGIDYIISSPGSEWPPVWEALARQKINEADGPTFINTWHESLAVSMAMGYTSATGRLQAVLLHAGVGLLQGSMAIQAAYQGELPMLVCSGESYSFGEDPNFDPGSQWIRGLSTVGGPNRYADPYVKWSGYVNSPFTLHDTVIRAAEIAQRTPQGPTFLGVPLEVMLHEWSAPEKCGPVPAPSKLHPDDGSISKLADLLCSSVDPVIFTEEGARTEEGYRNLLQLAELLSIPVVEAGTPLYSNFPKDHPLHMGFDPGPFMNRSDLFLVVGARAPWYPSRSGPSQGTVVVMNESTVKEQMAYQNLQADMYVEGDIPSTLQLLIETLQSGRSFDRTRVESRRARWEEEHNKAHEGYRAAAAASESQTPTDPVWLCAALNETMPQDTIYVEETISHRSAIMNHVSWSGPHRYFHPSTGGLGLGLGTALGIKLAKRDHPVVALMGEGAFLYNPITQAFGASLEHNLPILIVMFNNGKYAAMEKSHLSFYPEGAAATSGITHGVDIPGPNYAQLVEPFGGSGERVEEPGQLKPALEKAMAAVKDGRLALVDVVLAV